MTDRKRTIEDMDDVDDEDGVVMAEQERDSDLTLQAVDPEDVIGPDGTIARENDEGPPDPKVSL